MSSRRMLHWNSHRCSLVALTGQVGVFTRGASATAVDARGNPYTAVNSQPAWTWIDGVPHLLLGADDRLYWPYRAFPRAMTAVVRFVELGTAAIDDARVMQIGAADDSEPRFVVTADTTAGYAATYESGSVRTSTFDVAPGEGNAVELIATLDEYGAVQVLQDSDRSAQSETLALAGAWSGALLSVNGIGSSHVGVIALESIELIPAIDVALRNFGRLVIDGDGYSIEPGEGDADAYFVEDGDGYSIETTPIGNVGRILMRGSNSAEIY